MATLQAIQDGGNFTSATTWAVGTNDITYTVQGATGLTTTATPSLSFVPGAITVEGVSLYLNGVAGVSPVGTLTVELYNVTTSTIIASTTINVADLPTNNTTAANSYLGWAYFKFASTYTLSATDSYSIRAKISSGASIVSVNYYNSHYNMLSATEEITSGFYGSSTGMSRLSNQVANPIDGAITADKLIESTTSSLQGLYQSKNNTSNPYNYSVYLKAGERNIARISISVDLSQTPSRGVDAYFNLTTGTIASAAVAYGAATNPAAAIEPVVGFPGWYRCSVSCTLPISASAAIYTVTNICQTVPYSNYAGTSGFGFYMFGTQLTKGADLKPYQGVPPSMVNNWFHSLITTTNQAPTPSDSLIITGTFTGMGTNTPTTVNMDVTSNATTYGHITIACKGTLTFNNNSWLKIAGHLHNLYGGTLNIGTSSTPITANLEFGCQIQLQYYLSTFGGVNNIYGVPKTNFRAKLNADVSAGATSSITDISTDWKSGDKILVPSTSRTPTEFEIITLNADTLGTSMTHNAYTYAHGGNAITYIQADIANISRSINIFSSDATKRAAIYMNINSIGNFRWSNFYDLGDYNIGGYSITYIISPANVNTLDIQYCTIFSTIPGTLTSSVFNIANTNSNISNNIIYRTHSNSQPLQLNASTIVENIMFIANTILSGNPVLTGSGVGNNCVCASNNSSGWGGWKNGVTSSYIYSNLTGSVLNHSVVPSVANHSVSGLKMWRNVGNGIQIYQPSSTVQTRETSYKISNSWIFGNGSQGIVGSTNGYYGRFIFENCYIYGDPVFTCTWGVFIGSYNGSPGYIGDSYYFNNCILGKDDLGNSRPFSNACVASAIYTYVYFYNCIFNGVDALITPQSRITQNAPQGQISYNHNQVVGAHKLWTDNAIHYTDYNNYFRQAPSLRIEPRNANVKSPSPVVRIPVRAGNSCTVGVNVLKNLNYNLLPYSEDFTNNTYWSKTATTLIPTSNTTPIGNSSYYLNDGVAVSGHSMANLGGIYTAGKTYTYSCIIKKAAHSYIALTFASTIFGGSRNAVFNFDSSTFTTQNNVVANVVDMGNGYKYVSITATATVSSGNDSGCVIASTNNTNSVSVSYTGTNTNYVELVAMQMAESNTPLPYMANLTIVTNYNGNQPRLMYLYNSVAGNFAETVATTMTEVNGNWQQLAYTTPIIPNDCVLEFYVDCDGTRGWINIDGWDSTTSNNSRGTNFNSTLGTYIETNYIDKSNSGTEII